jgi:outer membrane protein insertion porin family
VPGTTDQVDINLAVKEKPTGNISLGAGYSTAEKLTLSGSVQQANAFGSGNTIGLEINTSKINRTLVFSQTNPYFTDDGVSRTYDLYVRTSRPALVDSGNYAIKTKGGDIKFGVPFTDLDTVFFGAGVEDTYVETDATSPSIFATYVNDFGSRTTSFPLTVGWQRDSRDSLMTPSRGRYQRANLELAAFGDLQYYRSVYQHQYYFPVTSTTTLALNGEFDYGRSIAGKAYPVFKNFYAGGIGSVRGYNSSSIGPRDTNGDPVGGTTRVIANAELQLPFGAGTDRSIRWFTFFDAGNVYATGETIKPLHLRSSVGLGISWISPMGPLKFSYGKPLRERPTDNIQRLQFQIGTGF